jgi:hypothetical protein
MAKRRREDEPETEAHILGSEDDTIPIEPPEPEPSESKADAKSAATREANPAGTREAKLFNGGQPIATLDIEGDPRTIRHDGRSFVRRIPGVYVLVQAGPPQTRHG